MALVDPDTRNPAAVEAEVQRIYSQMYPNAGPIFVAKAFFWAIDCFTGHYEGYQAVDARYHDFEHTLQGTLCMARLLHGRWKAGTQPALSQRMFELGLLAILFHDTGYLKTADDREGTGAKYTLTHVSRSAEFAARFLKERCFSDTEIASVQNMIRCTGVNVDLSAIPFRNDLERIAGYALGTADLLGQMAADDYVEKLPVLFQEFAESERYNAANRAPRMVFANADELMQKTPMFWAKYVQPKINGDFQSLYRYLGASPRSESIEYIQRFEANFDRL